MIFPPDKRGFVDGMAYSILEKIDTEVPLVATVAFSNYQFNPELLNLKKWVLFDFAEYGANDWDRKETHFWGVNSEKFIRASHEEWMKFDSFVKDNPPLVYFKRELLKKDFKNNIFPLEYPCQRRKYNLDNKEEFENRPLSVFHCWGWSHESRRILHGNIFVNAALKGHTVIDNFSHFKEGLKDYSEKKNVWATICVPHFARTPMDVVLDFNGKSKLSVSLPGAGVKCFRSTGEAGINSTVVMQEDNLAWSYEWVHGKNCIKIPMKDDMLSIRGLENGWDAIETIEQALQREDLYEIYLNSVATIEKYRIENYTKNYIIPIIQKYDRN